MVSWVSSYGLTEVDHSYPVMTAKDWLLGCRSERMGLLKSELLKLLTLTWIESPGRIIPRVILSGLWISTSSIMLLCVSK